MISSIQQGAQQATAHPAHLRRAGAALEPLLPAVQPLPRLHDAGGAQVLCRGAGGRAKLKCRS